MSRNVDLGAFLRIRRARIDPTDVGLRPTPRRRVPGLRREELAVLVGVSQDYYARLEQGRQVTASRSVLDALATALRLTSDERRHLYALAGAGEPRPTPGETHDEQVDPGIQRVVDLVGDTPAIVCGPYTDVLAANDAARFLLGDITSAPWDRRFAVHWILSPEARALYGDEWENTSAAMIGMMRLAASRNPTSRRVHELVTELAAESELFRQVWAEHHVSGGLPPGKTLSHPAAGRLELTNVMLTSHSAPEQSLVLVVPRDRGRFEAAFRRSEM